MRISIRQRIAIGLLMIIGLLLIVVVTNTRTITTYRQNTLRLSQEILPEQQILSDFRAQLSTVRAESLSYLLTGNIEHLPHQKAADSRCRELLAQISGMLSTKSGDHQDTDNAFNVLTTSANRLLTLTEEALIRYQNGNHGDVAAVTEQFDQAAERVDAAVDAYQELLRNDNAEVLALAQTNPQTTTRVVGVFFIVMLLSMFVLIGRSIIRPIVLLRDATLAVAAGDRERHVAVTSNDEIGDLAQAFNSMVQQVGEKEHALAAQIASATQARQEAEAAQAKIAEQLKTIADQREAIREMSVPILPLSSEALVVPLMGSLDSSRLLALQERTLQAIQRGATRSLILDITAVPVVDSQVAQGLIRLVAAAGLLGTQVVLVGVRPEVAQALVELGIDLNSITTMATLQSGIAHVTK